MRLALGMSRGRLAAMLCIETTLLALAAGIGATVVAIWGGMLLRTLLMPGTHFAAWACKLALRQTLAWRKPMHR